MFFSPNSSVQRYAKIKLVPFGEKVPLIDIFPILGKWIKWNVGISSWNTGTDTLVFNYSNKNKETIGIGGVICIESIYPDFVSAFVQRGADLLVVVTNDSWYGNSSGPYQHKEISVLRAVENCKPLVRAANGGISCIIDHYGQNAAATAMFTRDVLVGDVELISEPTFFSKYPLLMPNISLLIVIFIILYSIFILFKSKAKSDRLKK